MTTVLIRRLTNEDAVLLQQIGRKTFDQTFSSSNSKENMEKYLEEGFSLTKLKAEIDDPNAEFFFATLDNNIIGYLKLNIGQSQTEITNVNALEIERIYVLKEFHGQNIGQQLFEKAIERAYAQKVNFIWLGVWEENKRAIQFYTKNGFVAFDKHIFKLGDDEQTDIMMKRQISPSMI
jgi:ribosomal protein S18 acetylase RimI-like enzyme